MVARRMKGQTYGRTDMRTGRYEEGQLYERQGAQAGSQKNRPVDIGMGIGRIGHVNRRTGIGKTDIVRLSDYYRLYLYCL